jgi:hypothetical protein
LAWAGIAASKTKSAHNTRAEGIVISLEQTVTTDKCRRHPKVTKNARPSLLLDCNINLKGS